MKYIGADIPKVAFTPNSEEDVEKLIRGASLAHEKIGDLIAISMGELGQKTRKKGIPLEAASISLSLLVADMMKIAIQDRWKLNKAGKCYIIFR